MCYLESNNHILQKYGLYKKGVGAKLKWKIEKQEKFMEEKGVV